MKKLTNLHMRYASAAVAILCLFAKPATLFAAGPTNTSLVISPATAGAGTAVTLTASVDNGSVPVSPGLVKFCDAAATTCEGPSLLGTAQLTSAGTASIKVVLSVGTHSIKAVFAGKLGAITSASTPSSITVTGALPTSATIAFTGAAGSYVLSSEVSYHGLVPPGTAETVSFRDTSNSNYNLGTASLSAVSPATYTFITLPSSPFSSGAFPVAEAAGDFNGDGIPDLAVANFTSNTVSVFAGDGKGGFTPLAGSPFAVGNGPTALAVADVNNDNLPDLLCVNGVSSNVSVLLGNGGHSLTAGGTFVTGNGPQAIAVGDFNSDGNADMAIANLLASSITVLIGDGTGAFTNAPPVSAYTSGNPNAIVAADFDGNGTSDLAVANVSDGTVSVLLGDGLGSFTSMSGSPFATQLYPSILATGDLNADGKADLAVGSGTQNSLSILLNTGSGWTAPAGSPFTTGVSPSAVVVSDFNGDSKLDLATANANDNSVTVLLGDGTGIFAAAPQSPLTDFNAPPALTAADFNADGTPDLAVANIGVDKISIRPVQIAQKATATLASAIAIPGGGSHLVAAAYGGGTSYSSSTSATVALTGSKISTTAALFVSPSTTVQYLQTMQLTGTIAPPSSANYQATGAGTFADGGATVGSGTISNGTAVASINSLSVGTHNLTFSYAGDANFAASATASATTVTVTKANTSTRLAASTANLTPGVPVTFTATVTASTAGTPTGTVNFFSDGTLVGSGSLTGGVAAYTTSSLATGSHTITATYAGDANYVGSSAGGTPVVITISDFTMSLTPANQTVIPGQSVSYTLTVTPVNGSYNAPVSLTISGLPSGATASFQSATLTPGSNPASTTLTILVLSPVASVKYGGSIALALILLPFAIVRRRQLTRGVKGRLLAVILLAGVGIVASGCGRGNGYLGLTPKNYTVTVTATSGAVSHSSTVTLNVQ